MNVSRHSDKPDLDSRAHIESFVDRFYQRLLADPQLGPIFTEVAAVDLAVHLPRIKDYWCKLLLGEQGYRRHTMEIHRRLHRRRPLQPEDFERWLATFTATVDDYYQGQRAERAKHLARSIAANMQQSLC
ncbi:group III truncated hemoglobin [Kineobactrum salinum]|uniref:Group III truncated hemoglobin n=1 Tax=Kineobactrum salinum TaxID=2708301 RepID=A0A6C0U4L5_9GAMM|nr:group III truncated hemoglobin [Kineobactrum salinum]QIB66946.1 group III truncated hemoglobin [Kineobactrum salinum]